MTMISIAFVGAGPTTLYTLRALLDLPVRPARITIFEAQPDAGPGTPYSPEWNSAVMLSNIASAEIPPVTETLLDWLNASQDLRRLQDEPAVDDRTFVPRLVLGRYFQAQFMKLMEKARRLGVGVELRTRCRVTDVANASCGIAVSWLEHGRSRTARFDHVVLATGHQWPSRQQTRPGYFTSPWPAANLEDLPPTRIGVRGSSLTAIDAAVAIASHHGDFVPCDDGLVYEPRPGTEDLRITMMSRKGLLPEADFYFPLPHAPLSLCTPRAIRALIDAGEGDLLERAFDLFRQELQLIDPAYAASVGLADADLEAFGEAYFAKRVTVDPFEWARANLAEARANHAARVTVPWRDALLRLHEVVGEIVPHLDDRQFDRFQRTLKPVFVDAYGAVPHETVERLLALRHAGKLELIALGDDYAIDTRPPEGGAVLIRNGESRWFPVFLEATGQRVLSGIQFPFLSLIEQGIIRDVDNDGVRGIHVDEGFSLVGTGLPPDRLFCLSLPFIMGRHPFAQGITSSHRMGEVVGQRLSAALAASRPAVDIESVAA